LNEKQKYSIILNYPHVLSHKLHSKMWLAENPFMKLFIQAKKISILVDLIKAAIICLKKILKNMPKKDLKKYWRTNLKYLGILLSIWFLVSFVMGIILVDQLNTIKFGGFKLGFWFAQQGSIYFFVVIILVYIRLMNKLDKKYGVNE